MNYLMDANPAEAFINSDGDDVAYLGRLTTAWDGRGFRTDRPLSDDEWQRLINLVAAAPAMLSVLRGVAAQLTESMAGTAPWPNEAGWSDILGDCMRAIDKAEKGVRE